jgi:hypothetical protein
MSAERRRLEQGDMATLSNLKYIFDRMECGGVAVFLSVEDYNAKRKRETEAARRSVRFGQQGPSRR